MPTQEKFRNSKVPNKGPFVSTDERMDSHSDYSADRRLVHYLMTKRPTMSLK